MPWRVQRKSGQYCVVVSAGPKRGQTVACHDNRQEAEDHVAALYANDSGEAKKGATYGGKPSKGTKADQRLTENKPKPRRRKTMWMAPNGDRVPYRHPQSGQYFAKDKEAPLPEHWRGPLVVEGSPTDDGRLFAAGSLDWRDLPLPLQWQKENLPGHQGAVIVARIDKLTKKDSAIWGEGTFDLGSEDGREAARLVRDGFMRGVSVDVSVDDSAIAMEETEEGGHLTVFSKGRILGATLLPLPAFAEAYVEPFSADWEPITAEATEAIVASLDVPDVPPLEWFEDPDLSGPTPLTVTEDGQVFGHLATWDTCHISLGGANGTQCVRPPRSRSNYAYFKTGELLTQDGTPVPVGQITLGTGHADLSVGARAALGHYDNTGWVGADVTVGEDDHGIWVAGALRSGLSDAQLREFRAAPLSGDWRKVAGTLELVGALAVNVPGFPVRRAEALLSSGEPVTLVVTPVFGDTARQAKLEATAERLARSVGLGREARASALAERVGL